MTDRPPAAEPALAAARRLAWLLDDAVRLPGGARFGLDAVLGLIPVVGDALGLLAALRIVVIARRAGVPGRVLLRMLANIVADALVGAVPLLGDVFDFAWKANARNVALLEAHVRDRRPAESGCAGIS